ncbi:NUDIX hydrolase [Rhizobium rhizogenes]|uniref:NUDIX hydrolase n=1 Tax=Rhizobium rhizogenes TaxID=359 RepID=UPI000A5E5770|nr:NUDIX hydrolase [Rhizobium rhizogenes]
MVEVLLITSRETGRWIIPKGWSINKKKPHQVAKQEAWEEAGVRGHVRKKPFGHYRYEKRVSQGEFIPCLVQVHLLAVSELEEDFPEKGQRQIRWFSPTDAARAVDEPELQRLFMNLQGSQLGGTSNVVRSDDALECF